MRNGSKNNPNHYHPNILRTGVVAAVPLGSGSHATRVVAAVPPEPMNEPMKEPPIRRSEEYKIGLEATEEKRSGEEVGKPSPRGQPKPQWETPVVEEIPGTAEANLLLQLYAAPPSLLRPVISRFEKPRRNGWDLG